MSPGPSLEIDTLDPHSLQTFLGELIDAGFDPQGNASTWVGPIDAAFAELTAATTMKIVIQDGWPFRYPKLFVEGLAPQLHLNPQGEVCLWNEGDFSYGWLTLNGFRSRITEWCTEARAPSERLDNRGLDAHLYFNARSHLLATLDLQGLQRAGLLQPSRRRGELGATIDDRVARIEKSGPVRVLWYFLPSLAVPPPDLAALGTALPADLARNWTRALERVRQNLIVLLLWETSVGVNALAVLVTRTSDGFTAQALEVARTDLQILQLRAGSDAPALSTRKVVIFGLGAIGSHVALLLARSGVGKMCLVDGGRLRPGDVTRHAAEAASVGRTKAKAVEMLVKAVAPWTVANRIDEYVWEPDRLEMLISGINLVVEATGSRTFAEQVGLIAARLDEPPALVSAALYRGGAVARVQVQLEGGRPIHERTPENGFPLVPSGPGSEATAWETGCGAPVNNAAPSSVASAAALAARTAIDVLAGRITRSADLYETYRSLDADSFRELGPQNVPA